MGGLRILITNITLATRTGTELYVRDLAIALLDRGHTPMVYSPHLGAVAQELQVAGVPVVDDLRALPAPPEVIHGHHNLPTMLALLRLSRVPAVFICHDCRAWHDRPPRSTRILRYVAVDLACRDRLVLRQGIPADRAQILMNFVDLKRFAPRPPLPERPARALVFSNNASKRTHLVPVREACARLGIAVDVIGASAGKISETPEEVLGGYDIVFAKGRCALEALAVGAAVVLCDAAGAGPMVTTGELDRLRSLNFGRRVLREPVHPAVLVREVNRYDPEDASEVSRRIRAMAGSHGIVDDLVVLYRHVIAEHLSRESSDGADRRLAAYLQVLAWRLFALAWRLDRRYGPIKYRFVLPVRHRLRRLLMREGRAERGRNGFHAA
jgi:hypothetical protein